jgi:uncharacterized protein (DUF1501 family)
MKRREFMINTAAASAGVALMNRKSYAKERSVEEFMNTDSQNILIIIELFGGNDGLNTIIPYDQEELYLELRPNLHIPKEFAIQFGDSDLFLNSGLIDGVHNGGMMNLMATGKLAVVQGIGYDNPTLSHFRSSDIWHSGINSSDPNEKLLEGWLGRYFAKILNNYPDDIPAHPIAISLEGTIPLMLKSSKGDMGVSLQNPERFYQLGAGLTPKSLRFHTPTDSFHEREFNFIHVVAEQSEKYSEVVKEAYEKGKDKIKVNYSTGLPQKFRVISSLIAGGIQTRVFYMRLSNFDSHAQQMQYDYTGAHYTLLNNLARGVCEFLDDAQQQGFADRIVGMTTSEFGRRVNDNGSRGTDHGAASMQFMFAGSDEFIEGGYYRVEGKPDLNDLDEFENLRHQYDFRRTYNDVLETWLGASPEESRDVFGDTFLPLGILNKRGTSVWEFVKPTENQDFLIYPNPSSGNLNIRFELKKYARVIIELYSTIGQRIEVFTNELLPGGNYNYNYFVYNTGEYNIAITVGNTRIIKKFIVIR